MCWINDFDKISIAEEDITCYKVFRKGYFKKDSNGNVIKIASYFRFYTYYINKLCRTIKIRIQYDKYKKVYFINEGYHSYIDQAVAKYKIKNSDTFILKCIIPKGTKYAENRDGELVSSTMIITKEIA